MPGSTSAPGGEAVVRKEGQSSLHWPRPVRGHAQLIIMVIVERLHLTNSVSWLEEHIDYMSTQALLFEHVGLSFVQQTRLFTAFRTRLSD